VVAHTTEVEAEELLNLDLAVRPENTRAHLPLIEVEDLEVAMEAEAEVPLTASLVTTQVVVLVMVDILQFIINIIL
jgi:hypothetical protein